MYLPKPTMKIMYRNVRDRLLAEFDVQNPPYLKNFVQPLYFSIAFEPDDEIMAAQVAQLAEFKEQIRRLLPGSPDTSNNSVYELVEVDVEANEELIAALAVFKSTFQKVNTEGRFEDSQCRNEFFVGFHINFNQLIHGVVGSVRGPREKTTNLHLELGQLRHLRRHDFIVPLKGD
jgi:hypothetical protein